MTWYRCTQEHFDGAVRYVLNELKDWNGTPSVPAFWTILTDAEVEARRLLVEHRSLQDRTGQEYITYPMVFQNEVEFLDTVTFAVPPVVSIPLDAVLADGNTTGGTDIVISAGDEITSNTTGRWFNRNGDLAASTDAYDHFANTVGDNSRFMHLVSGINVGSNVTLLRVDQSDIAPAGATIAGSFVNTDTTNGLAIEAVGKSKFDGTGVFTGDIVLIEDSFLTSGRGLCVDSNSADTSVRTVVEFVNNNPLATGAKVLTLRQDSDARTIDLSSSGITADTVRFSNDSLTTGTVLALQSNSADTSTRTLLEVINDNVAAFNATCATFRNDGIDGIAIEATGRVNITSDTATDEAFRVVADSLTTGRAAQFFSNSANTSTRSIVVINNSSALATGTTCLEVEQLSTGLAIDAQGDVNIAGKLTVSGLIDPTGLVLDEQASVPATPTAAKGILWVRNDTPNTLVFTDDAGTDFSIGAQTFGETLTAGNASNGTDVVISDGDTITSTSTGTVIDIDSTSTTSNIIDVTGDTLTTGSALSLYSNSSSNSTRRLLDIYNSNVSAISTACIRARQDANQIIADLYGDGITTSWALAIDANSLTTGKIARFYSSSADASARTLVDIHNDAAAAVGAICLNVRQDANGQGLLVSGVGTSTSNIANITGNALTTGSALLIDSLSASASTRSLVELNQSGAASNVTVLDIITAGTGGYGLQVTGNSLTTGTLGRFYSNSANTGTRNLVEIVNDNTAATGTECLFLQQDANDVAMTIDQNANNKGLWIQSDATASIAALDVVCNSLTSGTIARFTSASSDASSRELVQIINESGSAVGAICLDVRQDADQNAVLIDGQGVVTDRCLEVTADSLGLLGQLARFSSNSANTDARYLVEVLNDNTLATGAVPLRLKQDANQIGLRMDMDGITTQYGLYMQADALTTGRMAWFYSNSANASSRNLVEITNDNAASGATCLRLNQDANATVFDVDANGVTTANSTVFLSDTLTTGKLASFYSNGADASSRNLVQIYNDNAAATGAIPLYLIQDAANTAMWIDQNGDGFALGIDAENTTSTGLNVQCDALTTGRIARFASNSADATGRNLVAIVNDNAAATGATCLFVNQDANQTAVSIDGGGVTTDTILEITSTNALTTGRGINIFSNSSAGSGYVAANFECGGSATGTACRLIHSNGGLALDLGGTNARARFDSSIEYAPATVAAATYSVVGDDRTILVSYTATGAVTITIPTAQMINGRELVIKDIGPGAGTNNITIATGGAETIDGAASYVMNNNYQSVTLTTNGTNWFIV